MTEGILLRNLYDIRQSLEKISETLQRIQKDGITVVVEKRSWIEGGKSDK